MPSREALETSRASFDGKTRFRNAMWLHQQNIVTADLRDQVCFSAFTEDFFSSSADSFSSLPGISVYAFMLCSAMVGIHEATSCA